MTYTAGQRARAGQLNDDFAAVPRIVARGNRTTSSTATTTEVGVLRLDNIPVLSGKIYPVFLNGVVFASSASGDLIEARLRASTSGAATTSSTQFGSTTESSFTAGGNQRIQPAVALYIPSGDATLSILLSVARVSGTGNVSLLVSAATHNPNLWVEQWTDPGDTGVDI